MRAVRMTTRRWMISVMATAIVLKGAIDAERFWRLSCHRAAALQGFDNAIESWNEGRLDLVKSVLASQRLMEAEVALSSNHQHQIAALSAHLSRAARLIESERNEPPVLCNDNREMWIDDAEATLVQFKARLKVMETR
jgi:hypothetical protein